ncbi:PQQ-like beta-propeller repeat protein [Crateriforma spongiae]|uniref:PQQ-like beta-propeller repeat protein n=1 Tax=Crateriforma spongiae TaxID=2724528 RepID=UPI001445A92D|nr:PQQ-like beta-propeller repeat protein [Crateriforma spongiae]
MPQPLHTSLIRLLFLPACLIAIIGSQDLSAGDAITSVDTGRTITKVRSAHHRDGPRIIASTYEGDVIAVDHQGDVIWTCPLSGVMNHDLWVADLDGDGNDEALAANADGHVYCISDDGQLRWRFKANDAPMYSVCVIRHQGKPVVVCGGFDNQVRYLSSTGELLDTLHSSTYSIAKPWGKDPSKPRPPAKLHVANFLRPVINPDDPANDRLLIHGTMNGMQDRGAFYLFKPFASQPKWLIRSPSPTVVGHVQVIPADDKTPPRILVGTSGHSSNMAVSILTTETDHQQTWQIPRRHPKIDSFGYRVVQPMVIDADASDLVILVGNTLVRISADLDETQSRLYQADYSFHDAWMDHSNGQLILASAQSGGSCIHLIDVSQPGWEQVFQQIAPPGKIQAILDGSKAICEQLTHFRRPAWEREPLPVYLMTESRTGVESTIDQLQASYPSPVFLNGHHTGQAETFDRSSIPSEKYRNRRDRRRKYSLSQQQALDEFIPLYDNHPGIAFWGGHGNDPFMFQPDTMMKVIDAAGGKKTVLIYPELEDHSDEFAAVTEHLIYPLAAHAQPRNANLFLRCKHNFWNGSIYQPAWDRLRSGEFADVFVPAMEETSDKSMEISLASRLGMWTSGAVNQWGARSVPDNTSFDRSRQHSHQRLPNHFLRNMVYNISLGATYINNFAVDQEYMSLLWEMIAKGALYVPKRDEIVSFNPVHLSMVSPDHEFLNEGNNVKWCTFYDADIEATRKMVFSRLNGTWPGAPNTPWDFSTYAAGVKDRRLNFLPPYPNGLVLITPPQDASDAPLPRGKLIEHLHPIYRDAMQEIRTNGKSYLDRNGRPTLAADQHADVVADKIRTAADQLPLTVDGPVAWVAAESSPTHLRLTIVDGGYLNPDDQVATVRFHRADPVRVTDLLTGQVIDGTDDPTLSVKVPCGLFRLLDVQLKNPL